MDKKQSTTTFSLLDMCEKLFNAFKPIFRPLRRLTFHHQEPGGTANPSSTRPNSSPDSGANDPGPRKELPTPVKPILPASEKKPAEAIAHKAERQHPSPKPAATPAEATAPKAEPHHPPPKPAATPLPKPPPPPPSESVSVRKVPDKVVPSPAPPKVVTIQQPTAPKAVPSPAPPKAVTIQQPTAPKAVPTPQLPPQPAPPRGPPAEAKKDIDERVEDFIKSARAKISRTGSGLGS